MQTNDHAIQNIGDVSAGGVTLLSLLSQGVPVVLGVLGILWFGLRFANWYRVNYLNKEPWKGV